MEKLWLPLLALLILTSCSKETLLQQETYVQKQKVQPVTKQAKSASSMTAPVFNVVEGTNVGSARLIRNSNGIKIRFEANDLTPGFAYTLWWVIWNNPEECGDPFACVDTDFANASAVGLEVMFAAGHVVGGSGKGVFAASLKEGDAKGSINDIFELPPAGGLADAQYAEVHAVLRNHGPAIPGQVNEQISGYPGGCVIDLGVFEEVPDAEGECGDTHATIFSSPNAP